MRLFYVCIIPAAGGGGGLGLLLFLMIVAIAIVEPNLAAVLIARVITMEVLVGVVYAAFLLVVSLFTGLAGLVLGDKDFLLMSLLIADGCFSVVGIILAVSVAFWAEALVLAAVILVVSLTLTIALAYIFIATFAPESFLEVRR